MLEYILYIVIFIVIIVLCMISDDILYIIAAIFTIIVISGSIFLSHAIFNIEEETKSECMVNNILYDYVKNKIADTNYTEINRTYELSNLDNYLKKLNESQQNEKTGRNIIVISDFGLKLLQTTVIAFWLIFILSFLGLFFLD